MSNIEPKPPEIIQKIEWLRINGLKHWKHLAVAFIFIFGVWLVNQKCSDKPLRTQESKPKELQVQESPSNIDDNEKLPKTSEIYDAVKRATVAIALSNENDLQNPYTIYGSGFCIHPRGIIVISRHVIEAFLDKPLHKQELKKSDNPDDGRLYFKDLKIKIPYAIFFDVSSSSSEISVPMARFDYVIAEIKYDLAIIRLHPHIAFPNGFPTVGIESYDEIHVGLEIATCGFPLGNFLRDNIGTMTSSFSKGILSSVIPSSNVPLDLLRGFQLDLTATNGNSGGPVFSLHSGKVFGVLQGGINRAQGFTIAQPIWPVVKDDTLNRILNSPTDVPSK